MRAHIEILVISQESLQNFEATLLTNTRHRTGTYTETQQDDLTSRFFPWRRKHKLWRVFTTLRDTELIFSQWRYKTAKAEMIPVVCTVGAHGERDLSSHPVSPSGFVISKQEICSEMSTVCGNKVTTTFMHVYMRSNHRHIANSLIWFSLKW